MKAKTGNERQAANSELAATLRESGPAPVFSDEQIAQWRRDSARYQEWKARHWVWRDRSDELDALLDADTAKRGILAALDGGGS